MNDGTKDPFASMLPGIGRGEESALASLYDRTSPRVFGLAVAMLGNDAAAEEVTLNVYTDVWKRAATYDPRRGRVVTWLLAITRSACLDWLRAQRRQGERTTDLEDVSSVSIAEPDPQESLALAEDAGKVRTAVQQLPDAQREALVTAFFGGLSYSQTAASLAVPEGTVKARIRAALGFLRQALGSHRECVR